MIANRMTKKFVNGNIGVALSGGGSRAMTAAMGQLRGLRYLVDENNNSLFSNVDYLSTVSGGSWLGATFTYLDNEFMDDDFLGKMILDPSKLKNNYDKSDNNINYLHDDNIGSRITSKFGIPSMAFEILLMFLSDVNASEVWQSIIGDKLLNYYNLYERNKHYKPISLFTLNIETKEKIINKNPIISNETFHFIKKKRPFLICNSSFFVKRNKSNYNYLLPFQNTPLYVGMFGNYDNCKSQENTKIGLGFVEPFCFNNDCFENNKSEVSFDLKNYYSLSDIIGTSSAFFSKIISDLFKKWSDDKNSFFSDIHFIGEKEILEGLNKYEGSYGKFEGLLSLIEHNVESFFLLEKHELEKELLRFSKKNIFNNFEKIIPRYKYWSLNEKTVVNEFADGGNLENTGLTALLSYENINKIITFINTEKPIKTGNSGIIIGGVEIEDTNVVVDNQVPPLFGFIPYEDGYIPYSEVEKTKFEIYRYNQVFKSEDFEMFLKDIKTNAGNDYSENTAYVLNKYEIVENKSFDISGDRSVEVLFMYLNMSSNWFDKLDKDIQKYIHEYNCTHEKNMFPHYSTIKTELSTQEINLMAHLTSYHICCDMNKQLFLDFFREEK